MSAEAKVCRYCSYDWRTKLLGTTPRTTNGLAVASMVVGIVSLLVFLAVPLSLVGAVVALLLGYRGSRQITRSEGLQMGREMARAGIAMGWVALLVAAALLVLAVVYGVQAISFDVSGGVTPHPKALHPTRARVILFDMPAAVNVRVPATVANLGPGFDALGIAVRMHLEIHIEPRRDSIEIMVEGEGADFLPADDSNLVIRSMNAFFDHVGRRPPGYAVGVRNPIPLESGLGASAAAVVGGLLAARAITGRTVPQGETVQMATDLEGHPDNVIPALVGGLVVCYKGGASGDLRHLRLEPSDRLVPLIAVPGAGYPTKRARKALPEDVSFGDAQFTASRAALLVAAMTSGSGTDVLAEAMNDRLHEPHRLKLMPETLAVHSELRSAGLAVSLAGAGPSLLIVVPRPEAATRAEQVRRVCRSRNAGWRVFVSEWELAGATALP